MAPRSLPDRLAAVAALGDPVRRAVFDLVARADEPLGRDATAEALGISRRIAALHLDRLAEQGLLEFEFRRPPGRGGPGAGRPAKLYRRAGDEVAVSVPERHYDVVGELLAAAVSESIGTGADVQEVLHRTAYDSGLETGTRATGLESALAEAGYEPRRDPSGAVDLHNCPFHRLARRYTDLVCGVNLDLLRGLTDGTGDLSVRPVLDPRPGRCCVRLEPA
ncbi:helix-turn-helix transcriptional regulator [Paractinoplanes atraurantiacus]|uniref:Predicted transcriptional regulator, ArsR family n=1 Tax=Paractinoplanes atraurantiacus TaxID=1036182 RepID=A0A285HMR0_9ACTN|nr:transcriptional regulator [Actinoplanes atraurantiacus]SNY36977.1 Predicted transcriptional regulator, ArsR family [Actinoplanes atraurantiacus]